MKTDARALSPVLLNRVPLFQRGHAGQPQLLGQAILQQGTLLCSDLFHQNGDVEAITGSDVVERTRNALTEYQYSPLADYQPVTLGTERLLHELAALKPKTLASMHGSTFVGDGERALRDLAVVMREIYNSSLNA